MINPEIHVGDGKSKLNKKRLAKGVGLFLLVVVFAGAAGAGLRWLQQQKEYQRLGKPDVIAKEATKAQDLALSGDFDKAHGTINDALDNPRLSADAKYDLLMQRGITYENQDDPDAAMSSYREAESIKQTMNVAQSIARMAELKGDKQLAISQYKKAIPLIPQDDAMKDSTKRYFENKITELEGGVVKREE